MCVGGRCPLIGVTTQPSFTGTGLMHNAVVMLDHHSGNAHGLAEHRQVVLDGWQDVQYSSKFCQSIDAQERKRERDVCGHL